MTFRRLIFSIARLHFHLVAGTFPCRPVAVRRFICRIGVATADFGKQRSRFSCGIVTIASHGAELGAATFYRSPNATDTGLFAERVSGREFALPFLRCSILAAWIARRF